MFSSCTLRRFFAFVEDEVVYARDRTRLICMQERGDPKPVGIDEDVYWWWR
jgi:hypothetical protein